MNTIEYSLSYTNSKGQKIDNGGVFYTMKQLRIRAKTLRANGATDFYAKLPSGEIQKVEFPNL